MRNVRFWGRVGLVQRSGLSFGCFVSFLTKCLFGHCDIRCDELVHDCNLSWTSLAFSKSGETFCLKKNPMTTWRSSSSHVASKKNAIMYTLFRDIYWVTNKVHWSSETPAIFNCSATYKKMWRPSFLVISNHPLPSPCVDNLQETVINLSSQV
jgi:hypothetical protein